jgi:hypothetical protein
LIVLECFLIVYFSILAYLISAKSKIGWSTFLFLQQPVLFPTTTPRFCYTDTQVLINFPYQLLKYHYIFKGLKPYQRKSIVLVTINNSTPKAHIIIPKSSISTNSQHACLKSREAQVVLEHLISNQFNKPTNIVAQVTNDHGTHAITHLPSSRVSISHQPDKKKYEIEPAGLLNQYCATANICIC